MTGLEEENQSLRAEVNLLRKELEERDQFIALLSSQLTNLQLLQKESGIYSISDIPSAVASNYRSTSRSSVEEEVPTSPYPLEPPRRSLEPSATRLDSKITEEAEDVDKVVDSTGANNKEKEKAFNTAKGAGDSDETYMTEKGKVFQSAKGAIKALPRELSIINSDSDDITKYSVASGIFRLERTEMRDAYNARGLTFDGLFKSDDAVKGSLTFPDGAKYIGELNDGKRHGVGIYYFAGAREKRWSTISASDLYTNKIICSLTQDGSRYEGRSVNNCFEGQGKMVWEDGGFYEGEVRALLRCSVV
ncbi:MAG: hypothetical protein SGBAC_000595 [Bacillariaceae sp.]